MIKDWGQRRKHGKQAGLDFGTKEMNMFKTWGQRKLESYKQDKWGLKSFWRKNLQCEMFKKSTDWGQRCKECRE